MNQDIWTVVISDKDGLWGSVDVCARDAKSARAAAKEYISDLVMMDDTDFDIDSLNMEPAKAKVNQL